MPMGEELDEELSELRVKCSHLEKRVDDLEKAYLSDHRLLTDLCHGRVLCDGRLKP